MTDLALGGLAFLGTLVSAFFAYKAAIRVKTQNGHTTGELVEDMAERLARVEMWVVDHLRDHLRDTERRDAG